MKESDRPDHFLNSKLQVDVPLTGAATIRQFQPGTIHSEQFETSYADSLRNQYSDDSILKIIRAKNEWESSVDCLSQIGVILLDSNLQAIRANKTIESWGLAPVNFIRGLHIAEIINPILGDYSRREFYKTWRSVNKNTSVEWVSHHNSLGKDLRFTFCPSVCDKSVPGMKMCTTTLIIDDITDRRNMLKYLQDNVIKLQHADSQNKEKLTAVNKKLEIKLLKEMQHKKKIRKYEKDLLNMSQKLLIAQDCERKRIASELHDGLGQILTAVKYQIEGVLCGRENITPQSVLANDAQYIEEVLGNIKSAMLEVRRISMNLRPSMLDEIGLIASMDRFFTEFGKVYSHYQIDTRIDIREEAIPTNIKFTIFRVLQEALNNIAKHANATSISVVLRELENVIILRIIDDGRGFDLSDHSGAEKASFGLNNMRERAESSAAKFTILSEANKGTVIQLQWRKNRI